MGIHATQPSTPTHFRQSMTELVAPPRLFSHSLLPRDVLSIRQQLPTKQQD